MRQAISRIFEGPLGLSNATGFQNNSIGPTVLRKAKSKQREGAGDRVKGVCMCRVDMGLLHHFQGLTLSHQN